MTRVARQIVEFSQFAFASKRAGQVGAITGTTSVIHSTFVNIF